MVWEVNNKLNSSESGLIEVKAQFSEFSQVVKKINKDLESLWNARIPQPYVVEIKEVDKDGRANRQR